MAISQEELIAFVAQCYDESLAGGDTARAGLPESL